MRIDKKIFTSVIKNLQNQQEKDNNRAKLLSDIYGSDINPNDNSELTSAIFLMLGEMFNPEQIEEISFFCYDQNFGKQADRDINDLWEDLIKKINVEYTFVTPR